MRKLIFERTKYGKELLIDATDAHSFDVGRDLRVLPEFYSIACIKEGRGHLEINTEVIPVLPQRILFFPPGQTVGIEQAAFDEGLFIFFEGEFLDVFFNDQFFIYKFDFFHNESEPSFLKIESASFPEYYQLFQHIHDEIKRLAPDSEHMLRALLYLLLVKLNRLYSTNYATKGEVIENIMILKFKYLLNTAIPKYNTVNHFAVALGISRSYLNKLSKDFFGKTAKEVVKQKILLQAKKDLLYSGKSIAEIAYGLHFADPPSFNRFFKKMTERTPQQFQLEFSKRQV